ncbi:hypothetical protein GGR56DRAFT_603732 [Xylariaceae sp. FL0804]|nr:hypothetical protein GGR56DRAFT_603732 [Xylariaceae sp. FL0804]
MDPGFPRFSELPAELRCHIWRLAIPCRFVSVRLRLDLDGWNSSTESDWSTHYRVELDGPDYRTHPPPGPPSLAGVNHEARAEVLSHYGPSLPPSTLKRTDRGWPVGEGAEIPWFNAQSDVLSWARVNRWPPNSDLFARTCLSVQHVEVENSHTNTGLAHQLFRLAAAVLDPAQPLQTLTVLQQLYTPGSWGRFACRYRVVRRPPSPRVLRKGEPLADVLARHDAGFHTSRFTPPPGGLHQVVICEVVQRLPPPDVLYSGYPLPERPDPPPRDAAAVEMMLASLLDPTPRGGGFCDGLCSPSFGLPTWAV